MVVYQTQLLPSTSDITVQIPKMTTTFQQAPDSLKNAGIGGIGAYKDISRSHLDAEKELKGTDKFAPASYPNYLPVWDNEKGEK